MIDVKSTGSFDKTESYLKQMSTKSLFSDLQNYGRMGVNALAQSTPKDSGKTAKSWDYRIIEKPGKVVIEWFNTNVNNGENIAILIQYGHATGNGGYIQSKDYINPAMRPVFENITANIWKKVTNG